MLAWDPKNEKILLRCKEIGRIQTQRSDCVTQEFNYHVGPLHLHLFMLPGIPHADVAVLAAIHIRDLGQIFLVEGEIVESHILGDAAWIFRFGYGHHALLKHPSQDDLSRGFMVLVGDLSQSGITELFALSERTVSLHHDALSSAELVNFLLLIPQMVFNLVNARFDRHTLALHQGCDMGRCEIADANGLDQTLLKGILQAQPRLMAAFGPCSRVVQKVQINVVKLHALQRDSHSIQCAFARMFVIPYFGRHKYL